MRFVKKYMPSVFYFQVWIYIQYFFQGRCVDNVFIHLYIDPQIILKIIYENVIKKYKIQNRLYSWELTSNSAAVLIRTSIWKINVVSLALV